MQNLSHVLTKIKFRNVLTIFCSETQVFIIEILPEIEFQIFQAFLSIEFTFVYILNILVKSDHSSLFTFLEHH